MEIPNETGKKPKRLTSVVWNHFERVRKGETCYAVCVHCNKKLSGSSNSGTTHLRNHLMRCLKRSNFDVSQLLVAKRKKKDNNTVTVSSFDEEESQRRDEPVIKPSPAAAAMMVKFDQQGHHHHHHLKKDEIFSFGTGKFDQDRSRSDLARMIILHGYPLSMIDEVGFQVFVRNLQPMFEVVSSDNVRHSCIEIYQKERQRVFETMSNFHGKINVSVENWSSGENSEYLRLTAHYIDEEWTLQKKIINFVALDSSHTEDLLSDVIFKCLTDWDIDGKLFSLTFDECSTDNDIVSKIKDQISQNRTVLGRHLFDIRSALHALDSIARDSIETLKEVVQKVRGSISHVKSSQVMLGKFNEMARQLGVTSQRKLALDHPSQWSSTHLMLEMAIEYRAVFSILQDQSPPYTSALTETEWEFLSSISGYLRLFADISNAVSSNKCPTSNIYFPEICDIHIQLIEWCKSDDEFIRSIALKMKAKFDQYWSKCSLVLAMAAILDPRFKMKLVEYYYSQIYGTTSLDRIKEVSDGVKGLFNAYTNTSTMFEDGSGLATLSNEPRDKLKGFDKYLHDTSQSQSSVSDLDKYLDEPIFPRNGDFNLLNWWKVHTPRYPILSMMARDLLGAPMSTMSSISPELRTIDRSRSSLSHETLEAFICTQDWLHTEPLDLPPLAIQTARPLLIEQN